LDEEEFARALLAHERREWQDPGAILDQLSLIPGNTVADLACGPGFFTVELAKRVLPGGLVYAVDSSPLMLRYLKSNLRRSRLDESTVKIIQSDVSRTSIPAHSVDLVLIANILHDIDDKTEFLREIKRISRSTAIIVDVDWIAKPTPVGPPEEIRLSEEKSKWILESEAIQVKRRIMAGPYHYGLLCELS
jgi:ubiquinone/menaquinone biosynthesis C-methylase UbiE